MHNSICCVAEQFSIQIMRYGTQAGTDCTVNSADITDVRWRTIIYIAPPSATISIRKQNNLPAYQIEPYDILDDINISNSKRTHQAANSQKLFCMTSAWHYTRHLLTQLRESDITLSTSTQNASIWSLTAAAPSDSVFRALCINWFTYLLTY